MQMKKLIPVFVDKIPDELEDGKLYVCIKYKVIVHNCACGCREKTVTPIDRKNGWVMQYDGESISLKPSIGNFNIKCHSHYYITQDKIEWLEDRWQKTDSKWYQTLIKKIKSFFK